MNTRQIRWRRRSAAFVTALVVTALVAAMVSLVGPAQPARAADYVAISGGGSTWSFNAFNAWIRNVRQYGMRVDYERSGSSTGRSKFREGTLDWAASDIPYGVKDGNSQDPPPDRGYVYMPDTAGGTTFMYNLKIGNKRVTNLRLSGENIAKIFTGALTKWNDPAIKADNPGLSLPAITIVPVVRSDGSGSSAQFTQWMVATQGGTWSAYCAKVGRTPCTQTSAYPVLNGSSMIGQPGDLGVAGYVSQEGAVGSIGYVEYSYAINAGFPVAKVLNRAGYYTEPTAGHVAVSLLAAEIDTDKSNKATYLTQKLDKVYANPDPADVRALVVLVHDPADQAREELHRGEGLHPRRLRRVRAVRGAEPGERAGLLGAADQPRQGRLRAAGPRARRHRAAPVRPAQVQQPDVLDRRHQHPGQERSQPAGLRQAGDRPVHHRHRRGRRHHRGQHGRRHHRRRWRHHRHQRRWYGRDRHRWHGRSRRRRLRDAQRHGGRGV